MKKGTACTRHFPSRRHSVEGERNAVLRGDGVLPRVETRRCVLRGSRKGGRRMKRWLLPGVVLTLLAAGMGRLGEVHRKRALDEALYSAVAGGDAARVSQLLQRGADPNARDQAGWSVLTQARAGKSAEVVRLIERAGGHD